MVPGHIAVEINSNIYGFYPAKDFPSPKEAVPGDMRKQTQHEVAEDYLELYLGSTFREEGIILDRSKIIPRDPIKTMPRVFIYSVKLSNESKLDLFDKFETYHTNPPAYHRKSNNCVTLTISALQPFLTLKSTYWPDGLKDQLEKEVGQQPQLGSGHVVSQDIREINYNFMWA